MNSAQASTCTLLEAQQSQGEVTGAAYLSPHIFLEVRKRMGKGLGKKNGKD